MNDLRYVPRHVNLAHAIKCDWHPVDFVEIPFGDYVIGFDIRAEHECGPLPIASANAPTFEST